MACQQNWRIARLRSACVWIWISSELIHFSTSAQMRSINFTGSEGLGGASSLSPEQINIHEHLKTLNKPSVRSVQSSDGDVIDCVPIRKQLAFDHPKLKDHKLQKTPSAWPSKASNNATGGNGGWERIEQVWHQSGRCPKTTIPVRRTKAEDLLRAASIQRYGRKYESPPKQDHGFKKPRPQRGDAHEHAIAYVRENVYYGAQASMNVWKPEIEVANEFSLSQMWLLAGSFTGDLNSIESGWQVSPELYGDTNSRLFTYWTTDEYQYTGCYNLLCSGFIQLSNEIALGASISPVSSYDGSQYDIQMLVWKDPRTGHWWLRVGDASLVGYWPAEIFSHLSGAASMIEWGGEVVNTQPFGQHTRTQMGSGRFASQGFAEASYFRNLGYVDADNKLQSELQIYTLADHPNCYAIQHLQSDIWENYFYYGGPGWNTNCL